MDALTKLFWNIAIAVMAWVAVFLAVVAAIKVTIIDVPDIAFAYSTGKCFYMVEYTAEGPERRECPDVLPERYNRFWVQ